MKEKIMVKGKEYAITSKFGMEDEEGKFIIPREYDAIIPLDNNLFAAQKNFDRDIRAKDIEDTVKRRSLEELWNENNLKIFSKMQLDFYSINGKFEFDKKVLACYWSKENHVLVLLKEDYTWSIAHLDFVKKEILEDDNLMHITRVKEIYGGRFLIERNGLFEIISLKEGVSLGPFAYAVENWNDKGIIFCDEKEGYGVMDYSGKVLISGKEEIEFEKEYIKAYSSGLKEEIYSYSGECIVSSKIVSPIRLNSGEILFKYVEEDATLSYGVVSSTGEILMFGYPSINILENGMIVYRENQKYGLFCYKNGKIREILEPKYKDIKMMMSKSNEQYIGAKLRVCYLIYDLDGNKIKDSNTPPELWAKK